ncbi:MAG TPA: TetR/AcrR family transcriptional regulator, partial [Candidatus Agrococcus pullicola]|nr:TetR/AcrR family transcriptional regulator [Candidatus Agrococcus pullicola]
MNTRDEILNAFEELIIEQGERAATISGVAAAAGVSKGGLLYHFGSKDALVSGLADRFSEQIESETLRLHQIENPVEVFLQESLGVHHPMDRTFIALIGLAQLGEHQVAKDALA